jgi:hypothetical protein
VFDLWARLRLATSEFIRSMRGVATHAEVAGKKIGASLFGGIGKKAAGLFAVGAMGGMFTRLIQRSDQIRDHADAVGLTAEKYQELAYAAKMSGASENAFDGVLRRLATSQAGALRGSEKLVNAFAGLGITQQDLASMTTVDLLYKISEGMKEGANSAETMQLAMLLMGRGVGDVFGAMQEGLFELSQEARRLGVILSEETVDDLSELADSWDQTMMTMQSTFGGTIAYALNLLSGFFTRMKAWSSMWGEFFGSLIAGEGVGEALRSAGVAYDATIEAVEKAAAERKAARAVRRGRRLLVAPGELAPLTEKAAAAAGEKAQNVVDALARIGGFTSRADHQARNLQQKQVDLLQQIEVNTREDEEPGLLTG